jgi:hypothetical protein
MLRQSFRLLQRQAFCAVRDVSRGKQSCCAISGAITALHGLQHPAKRKNTTSSAGFLLQLIVHLIHAPVVVQPRTAPPCCAGSVMCTNLSFLVTAQMESAPFSQVRHTALFQAFFGEVRIASFLPQHCRRYTSLQPRLPDRTAFPVL